MTSPSVPNGVSRIGPNADIMMLLGDRPTPTRIRDGRSAAGNPLPRTSPARTQVPRKTSGSGFTFWLPFTCESLGPVRVSRRVREARWWSKTGSDEIIRPGNLALDLNGQSLNHGSDRFDPHRYGSSPRPL